jgi:SAM-dependent methyltransferase
MTKKDVRKALTEGLWRIYTRPETPEPWTNGGNLPWDDPVFAKRMLREHLDESHGAASRVTGERLMLVDWIWNRLDLDRGAQLLDVTCGPGLYAVEFARRGCQVTGIDFSPAAIAYARDQARHLRIEDRCRFVEQDVRSMNFSGSGFDAATFIYGQLAVFPQEEAKTLLAQIAQSLRPGGRICVELLNQDRVDKKNSTWWFTDDGGLWGDKPFLHLGERFWREDLKMSTERFQTLNLDTGELDEIVLCDQTYSVDSMVGMMKETGFVSVDVHPGWDGLPLYDADEWLVYIGQTKELS